MALRDKAQGLLGGLQRFAGGVNGLLYPGFGSAGVDPRAAQAAQSQAMLQMGMGLLGGQNVGQAYGLGQAAGWEPIEQARRQELIGLEQAQRKEMADWREWQKQQAEQAAAQQTIDRNRARMYRRFDKEDAAKQQEIENQFRERGLRIQENVARQGPDKPADIRAFEYYMSLPPDQREQFLALTGKGKAQTSPAQAAVDRKFANEYVEFISGGAADAQKSIDELRGVITSLNSGKDNLTGGFVGNIPMWARSTVGSQSADIQQTVESTVQRSLRAILGAQFTEKEGERLIQRAYDPRLTEEQNAARVGRLLTQLERAMQSKAEAAKYYEENGTLAGFAGQTDFSASDFNPEEPPKGQQGRGRGAVMDKRPPAAGNKGRRLRETLPDGTVRVYESDGMTWQQVQ